MAAPKKNAASNEGVRSRIKTSQLINRLQLNGLQMLKTPLSPQQVRSIEILLRKTLPDLSTIEISSDPGAPVIFQMINRPPKEPR